MMFTTCSWTMIPNGLCRGGVDQNISVGKRFRKDTEMESIYKNGCNHNWEFQGVYPENFAQWHCKNCSIVHAQNLAEMMNELQRARQYKIERSAYVPGHWQCPMCHFYNVVTILNANTGQCGMAKEHDDPFCPNDGHPMERVTWMKACESTEQILKSEITRLAVERDTAVADLASAREEIERLRERYLTALKGVREAIEINGQTYSEPDWNPQAHVEITLTVAEVRLVRNAFD